MVFILDTTALPYKDEAAVLEKEKQLALSVLGKEIYKDEKVQIGVNTRSRPIELNKNKDLVALQINKITISDTKNLNGSLTDSIQALARISRDTRKLIALFIVGNKYNAYPEVLKELNEKNIKLVVVDVNKALLEPIVDPPYVAKLNVPDIADVPISEPEVSGIVVALITGIFYFLYFLKNLQVHQ